MPDIKNTLKTLYQQAEEAVDRQKFHTQFQFEVAGQAIDTFRVMHWHGTDKISSLYRYTLSLAASDYIDGADVLGKSATLRFGREGQMCVIHGQVREVSHHGQFLSDYAEEYQIVIESPLVKLHRTRQSRIFLNLDLKSVIEQILLTAGFAASSFRINLKNRYPVREYTAQYNESDFNFFTRLLDDAGIFYRFVQQEDQALLVIQDDSTATSNKTSSFALTYLPFTGLLEDEETVQRLQSWQHYLPKNVKRRDINYCFPRYTLLQQARSTGPGNDSIYTSRAAMLEEAEQQTHREQQALDCQRSGYSAETNCRGIAAGSTLTLSGLPNKLYDGEFLVVSVLQQGGQAPGFMFKDSPLSEMSDAPQRHQPGQNIKHYHNELTMIKKSTPYRQPIDHDKPTRINGLFVAKIVTLTGGDIAYRNEYDYYRLNKPQANTNTQTGDDNRAMSHPSADTSFPLHAGMLVLITCQDGNPNWPVILARHIG